MKTGKYLFVLFLKKKRLGKDLEGYSILDNSL